MIFQRKKLITLAFLALASLAPATPPPSLSAEGPWLFQITADGVYASEADGNNPTLLTDTTGFAPVDVTLDAQAAPQTNLAPAPQDGRAAIVRVEEVEQLKRSPAVFNALPGYP